MSREKLERYRAKRDFSVTAEPRGEANVLTGPRRRFVIQKHDATRLHYDLRLELDGVFKSWAVTKGPSLDPGDKRLAVEVEDHPLDYGDFEGTIPPGQYGGGTVQLWDRGFWAPEGAGAPEDALAQGDLKFILAGERLQGSFVLVRMKHDRNGGKRTNWLLIKHRDEFARSAEEAAALLAQDASVASGRKMAAIAAGRGRAPKAFMMAQATAAADAVWDSSQGLAADAREKSGRKASVRRADAGAARVNAGDAGEGEAVEPGRRAGARDSARKPARASGKQAGEVAHEIAALAGKGDTQETAGIARKNVRVAGKNAEDTGSRKAEKSAKGVGAARKNTGRNASDAGQVGVDMPGFVTPELCTSVTRPPAGAGWVHEIKFDGYRVQLRIEGGKATAKTRAGLDWSEKFGAIVKEAAALPDAIIDGEVVALDAQGAPDFAALQAALSEQKTGNLIFFAFDLLFQEGADLRDETLQDRKLRLAALLRDVAGTRLRYVEHFETGGDAILQSACKLSLEGIVSKRLGAKYRSGRSEDWTKAKCRAGHEVVIGGWTTTNGRFRSLLAGVWRDGHFIYVGRIGTGFGEAQVGKILPRLKRVKAAKSPFTGLGAPKAEENINWVRPELVAEIEFAGWTGAGSIRQAAFKGFREDKPARDVVAETPVPPKQADVPAADAKVSGPADGKDAAAKPGRRAAGAARDAAASRAAQASRHEGSGKPRVGDGKSSVMGVVISHPDKPLWPDAGDGEQVTKHDLAEYFAAVGEWLLPHIKGRPCSIIRAPNGFAGEQFFQRHAMPGTSNLLELVTVSGDRKPYLQIDRVEGLAAVAQVAALELHPWNCQPNRPDMPGRLVFDLDPGEAVEFSTVIQAAIEMRDVLDELGLVSFCKTTGGKGLHVVTPLAPSDTLTWKAAKDFAHAVCNFMAQTNPNRYLVNMAKKLRDGKIFLDYLRNDRMATAVAPLSPRARPGATVSMPITWDEVKPGLDPRKYTVRTVPGLLAKTTAWAAYCDRERPLEEAIRKLGKTGS
jgi:bifunctional non-homologous end joining protein LigD